MLFWIFFGKKNPHERWRGRRGDGRKVMVEEGMGVTK
jgi:hypothetical protein